jgi:hypothetical protein
VIGDVRLVIAMGDGVIERSLWLFGRLDIGSGQPRPRRRLVRDAPAAALRTARDAVDVEYWLQVLKDVRNVSARVTVDALHDRLRARKCQSTGFFHTDRSAPDVADDVERLAIQKFVNR